MKNTFAFFATAALLVSAFAPIQAQAVEFLRPGSAPQHLDRCGGYVSINTGAYGNQVNLVFNGVQNCSNFDIVGANGESFNYENRKLGGTDRNRSGSFGIPEAARQYGGNFVTVVVKSNKGSTSDTIYVSFTQLGYVAPQYPVYQVPALPRCTIVSAGWLNGYPAADVYIGSLRVTHGYADQAPGIVDHYVSTGRCTRF